MSRPSGSPRVPDGVRPFEVAGRDPMTGEGYKIKVAGGRIVGVDDAETDEERWLSVGLIDLQVNGFNGIDLNDGKLTPERVAALGDAMLATGVTTVLPTLVTAAEASIVSALRAIAAARAADPLVAHMMPFVHVEGPFVSPDDGPRGAHPREHVRPPDLAEVDRWQAACGGIVGLVTLSPHWPGAPDFIRSLVERGIRVAIGHTGATPEEIRAAADAGATLSTHLGNGCAATVPRHPNFLWAQLADDRLGASFIADGHHLPADALKAMIRAKGIERSVLVSDAVALGGLPPGIYDQPIGGRVELSPDGRLSLAGTPYLAGAARPLKDDVALAVDMAGLSLGDALRLATANPGGIVGWRGELAFESPADLILFTWKRGDRTLGIERVMVNGQWRI